MILVIAMAFFNVRFLSSPVFSSEEKEVKADIKDLEKDIQKEEVELQNLNSANQTVTSQINTTAYKINVTETAIERQENEIKALEKRIKLNQSLLQDYLRELYFNHETDALVEMIVFKDNWQKIVLQDDNLLTTKEKLLLLIQEINDNKDELQGKKKELEETKEEHEDLLAQKQAEKSAIVADINETKASISELQAKLSELRSDLNRILGKSYDTGEIKDAIKFAAKVTGVRKGFIFGMLSMESGGNPNAGRCTYKNADMSSARKEYFKDICDELDYDYKKKPVSCASKSYAGSGGAMGAAQFMSDTWWGYKSRIAKATGHNPPDPWSLVDGVMAMALKLENDEANTKTVSIKNPCNGKSVKVKGEIYASMRYLGWNCYAYTNYAPGVQNLANGYDDL